MPGYTSLGIQYPVQGEVVDAAAWQTMAQDIDDLMTSLDTIRDLAGSRPTASISGGSVATATGVDGTVSTFTSEDWDTGGYANLGVNNDRLTVPPGIYWCTAVGNLTGATTVTQKRLGILYNSIIWGSQSEATITSGNNNFSVATGLVVASSAATAIQVRTRWQGTGGPATTRFVNLRIYQVRELNDL